MSHYNLYLSALEVQFNAVVKSVLKFYHILSIQPEECSVFSKI
jgi:hypothetical protein